VHSSRLAAGQPARVLLGGEAILDGRVATVNPTIENGVLRFAVELDSPHDERLRNNLRVEVAVVTGHADGALRVRRGGFVEDGGESLFVIAGNRAVRRPARLGLVGYADVEIVSGLAEGEEVILTDMKDYAGLDELRLR
jgi:HlyD family secretion protein